MTCQLVVRLFLSTLSLRRATRKTMPGIRHITYFYPRSPCGERHSRRSRKQRHLHFYPRSPCGERQQAQSLKIPAHRISIHALLAESDFNPLETLKILPKFLSTLSLRRATSVLVVAILPRLTFLSTLSLRRATVEKVPADVYYQAFLSTLSLRRATTTWSRPQRED